MSTGKRQQQEPLVRKFAENAKRQGAAVYAGKSFAVAQWEDGKRAEIRVDKKKQNPRWGEPYEPTG